MLTPFDISTIIGVILTSVQLAVFNTKWCGLYHTAATENARRPQGDPLHNNVRDTQLLGLAPHADPNHQATWHPEILKVNN